MNFTWQTAFSYRKNWFYSEILENFYDAKLLVIYGKALEVWKTTFFLAIAIPAWKRTIKHKNLINCKKQIKHTNTSLKLEDKLECSSHSNSSNVLEYFFRAIFILQCRWKSLYIINMIIYWHLFVWLNIKLINQT